MSPRRSSPKHSVLLLLLLAVAPVRSAADAAPPERRAEHAARDPGRSAADLDAAPGRRAEYAARDAGRSAADVNAAAPGRRAEYAAREPDLHLLPPSSMTATGLDPSERGDGARRFALPAVEALGVHTLMVSWNRWVGAAPWGDVSADSIGRNLRSRWVLDDDPFWVNQFGHPYQGTWAFTAARSAGLGFWTAASYSFAASALWEIAGETERPARNDQITTPVAGVVLGEVLTRFSDALRAEGGPWRDAAASVLSPMSAVNRRLRGATAPLEAPASRWELSMAAASGTGSEGAWHGRAGFAFTWGLPGDPDLELARPFDHFVLEAAYGFAADPDATVRGRGLIAGKSFHPTRAVRGLWGLFLSFDLDTPGPYRVSTSAVGAGASGRADLGGGWALEAGLHGGAVLLGAAGSVARGPDGAGRDYLMGPGAQSLVDVALLAGTRGRAGVTLRQYLVLGEGEPGGTALLLEASAGATLRIVGASAIAVEVTRRVRRVQDATRHADTAVQLSYVLLGGASPGVPEAASADDL
ncbi:DUF3943 domain-containing protein [Anaeromyxobacter terrae]|uniref:DUF3943 domain-containing protein n=1 Tax=Anaeromyxobacter terrae TaxID=2925406 RepID=UPI001F570BC4|nr:DUF3943 domain-containing protein [Anaeromyxobacter sp. SG22]